MESGGASTTRDSVLLARVPLESVTDTDTDDVPGAVGVPPIDPPDALSPPGRPLTDHAYGGTPPVAPREAE